MGRITEAANRYVKARIANTKCMQRHFRQICSKCRDYSSCACYEELVDTWINLQKALEKRE